MARALANAASVGASSVKWLPGLVRLPVRLAACAAASRVVAPSLVSTSLNLSQQLQRPHVIWQYPAQRSFTHNGLLLVPDYLPEAPLETFLSRLLGLACSWISTNSQTLAPVQCTPADASWNATQTPPPSAWESQQGANYREVLDLRNLLLKQGFKSLTRFTAGALTLGPNVSPCLICS